MLRFFFCYFTLNLGEKDEFFGMSEFLSLMFYSDTYKNGEEN